EYCIRGFHVTGIQTCALPISYVIWKNRRINEITTAEIRELIQENMQKHSEAHRKSMLKYLRAVFRYAVEQDLISKDPTPKLKFKIGRASCREREEIEA